MKLDITVLALALLALSIAIAWPTNDQKLAAQSRQLFAAEHIIETQQKLIAILNDQNDEFKRQLAQPISAADYNADEIEKDITRQRTIRECSNSK